MGSISGLHHRILTTRRPNTAQRRDLLREAAEGVGIDFVPVPERMVGDPAVLSIALKRIREYGPDIIETHDNKSHFLLFLLRLFHRDIRRIVWVAFHHGYTRTSWRVRVYQSLDYLSLRYATRVNTLCQPFAADLVSRGVARERINILTNTVQSRETLDSASAAGVRSGMGINGNETLFLTVGRLSKQKGHEDLIEAFRRVTVSTKTPLRLVIVGDGHERQRLQLLARDLGDSVVFLGHVNDPWPLYNAADIFVLPSHSEGSPLVLFEAMAAGLPIVATAVGGVPEVLADEETGLLATAGSTEELTSHMLRLVSDSQLRSRLGEAGRRELSKHSPETYAARLLDVYRDAIADSRNIPS
jgi:glycosyltransferase involved in cell wall biosynthesis